jgi:hypothetical protein
MTATVELVEYRNGQLNPLGEAVVIRGKIKEITYFLERDEVPAWMKKAAPVIKTGPNAVYYKVKE